MARRDFAEIVKAFDETYPDTSNMTKEELAAVRVAFAAGWAKACLKYDKEGKL